MDSNQEGERRALERTSRALVKKEDKLAVEDDVELQKLWLAIQKHPWRSLAVIAGDETVSTIEIATKLAEIAWWYRGQPTTVVDLRELGLRLVDYQLREIAAQIEQGDCIIIALESVFSNPTTIAVANAVDAAVICIELGRTKMKSAERTIEEIGRDKFIGSIVIDPER